MERLFFLIILLVALFSFSFAQTGSGEFGKTSYIQAALKGDIYFLPEGTDMLPDFTKLKPIGSIYTKQLNIAPRSFENGFPGVTDRTEWFAIQYNGAFTAKTTGNYSFRLLSDDGSKLYIDGKLIIDNDGVHAPSDVGQSVDLIAGIHTIRVEYFQGPRWDIALQLFITVPNTDETLFSADAEIPGKTSDFGASEKIIGAFKGDIYNIPEKTSKLPVFSQLQPVGSIYTKKIDISPRRFDGGFPGVTDRTEWFAIQYNGAFSVKTAGTYTFRIHSDDGSKLYIDGELIIDNDGIHGPLSKNGTVSLNMGIHTVRVEYFQGPRYNIALQLFVTAPGSNESIFASDAEANGGNNDTGKISDFGGATKIAAAFKGDIYDLPVNTSKLPNFSQMKPIGSIYTKKIDISPRRFDGGFPGVTDRTEWFAIQYNGAFLVKTAGTYTFRLLSDDGSKLFIDGNLVIDNDGNHGPSSKIGSVDLNMGIHTVRVEYFQGPRYNIALQLFVTAPGSKESIFASDAEVNVGTTDTGKTSDFGGSTKIPASFKGDIYNLPVNTKKLPDFSQMKPVGTIYTKKIDIAPRRFDSGFPGVTDKTEWFAIQYNGAFFIKKAGNYKFRLLSDDGSKLYVDGNVVIDNDGTHGPSSKIGSVDLNMGIHTVRLEYFQGPRWDIALQLFVTAPGFAETIFATDAEPQDTTTTTTTKTTDTSSDFGVKTAIPGAFKGEIYLIPENTPRLPDFSKMSPVGSIYTKKIDISPRRFESGFPGVTDRTEWFGIQYNGAIFIMKGGMYSFRLLSDDGSKLYIDNKLVIDNDGMHPPQDKTGQVQLKMGMHFIRVEYFQGPRYDLALQLFFTPPGGKEQIFQTL